MTLVSAARPVSQGEFSAASSALVSGLLAPLSKEAEETSLSCRTPA